MAAVLVLVLGVCALTASATHRIPHRAHQTHSFSYGSSVGHFIKPHQDISRTRLYATLKASSSNPVKLIIAGAPASGKGTQCAMITEKFGVVHLSTGDILRAAVKEGTELGAKAKSFMDAGQLVPDELITSVICDRLQQEDCVSKGWLLDGFPRTKSQADALSAAGMVPDAFVLLDVPEEVLVERVTGRRTDPETGRIYHLRFSPPESAEVRARLVQRSDDTAEKIVVRYREFKSHIDAVKEAYTENLICVDGTLSQSEVSTIVESAISDTIAAPKQRVPAPKTPRIPSSQLNIIIAGAPASGKGTQCAMITEKFGVVHLSTGDILRAAVKEGTELGAKAKSFMDAGQLVPDELITSVICDRLQQEDCVSKGWLLDGFPRTKSQADALSAAGMVPDAFVLLDVPEEVLVERVTGRRTDPETGRIYHLRFSPPESAEVSARLVQRSDDTAEKIVVRYREFKSHIDAVKDGYADKLVWVDGTLGQSEVSEALLSALEGVRRDKLNDDDDDASSAAAGGASKGGSSAAATTDAVRPLGMAPLVSRYSISQLRVAHPVLLSVALAAFAVLNGLGLKGLLLGTAILSFGVQLFAYRSVRLTLATSVSAAFALVVFAGRIGFAEPATSIALSGARFTAADPSLAALIVFGTGILGTRFGEKILAAFGISSPARASARGPGTAAIGYDPVKLTAFADHDSDVYRP